MNRKLFTNAGSVRFADSRCCGIRTRAERYRKLQQQTTPLTVITDSLFKATARLRSRTSWALSPQVGVAMAEAFMQRSPEEPNHQRRGRRRLHSHPGHW